MITRLLMQYVTDHFRAVFPTPITSAKRLRQTTLILVASVTTHYCISLIKIVPDNIVNMHQH